MVKKDSYIKKTQTRNELVVCREKIIKTDAEIWIPTRNYEIYFPKFKSLMNILHLIRIFLRFIIKKEVLTSQSFLLIDRNLLFFQIFYGLFGDHCTTLD